MTSKKSIESVYLDKLKYDPNLERSFFSFFLDRQKLIFLIIMIITFAGIASLIWLPLESNPEVVIGTANISTSLPWASPEIVETLVTDKIEQSIAKVRGVDTVSSSSLNWASSISVQFLSTTDIPKGMQDLRDAVNNAIPDLPTGAKTPVVQQRNLDDTPVWIFSIAWPYNGFQLYEFAQTIQNELQKNPLVSEADISGWDITEFHVTIDPKKLDSYKLTLDQVNNILKWTNVAVPIWPYDIQKYTHTLSVDERYYTIEQVKNIAITKFGVTWIIHIWDVADVTEAPATATSISRLSSAGGAPQRAVTVSVIKKPGWSIVSLIDQWQATLKQMQQGGLLPAKLRIVTIQDNAERIRLDMKALMRDGTITILLVFSVLFLIIGIKEALVAGTSAPLVFFSTFIIMYLGWQTLNNLSMFALILSLGLLVDDAIVIISAINQYSRVGRFTIRECALLVLRDYRTVLISTTLTVVWMFSTMMFMTWTVARFVASIPFVMVTTLLCSLAIALIINPALAVIFATVKAPKKWWSKGILVFLISSVVIFLWEWLATEFTITPAMQNFAIEGWFVFAFIIYPIILILLKKRSHKNKTDGEGFSKYLNHWIINFEHVEKRYEKIITQMISSKKKMYKFLALVSLIFIWAVALPVFGILHSDFFPKTDQDSFSVKVTMEPWTKLSVTAEAVKPVEAILRKEKNIVSFTTTIGSWWWRSSGSNYATIVVNLLKWEYGRKETSMDIADRLRKKFLSLRNMSVTIRESTWWPPSGDDFQIYVAGPDFGVMSQIVNHIKGVLDNVPGAINVSIWRVPLPLEFRFSVDSEKLAMHNLTLAQVSGFLKNVTEGNQVTDIYKWIDDIVVRTIYDTGSTDTLEKIKNLTIPNSLWQPVYLQDIITDNLAPSVFSIDHLNQKRVIEVTASADKWTTSTTLNDTYNQKMKSYKIPSWYSFIVWGSADANAKSMQSLFTAVALGMLIIIITLLVLFDSYKQSFIVLVTIPLSLIWVFVWLVIFGQPLSFPGFIWCVALFGMVIRNWIILFDKINLNLSENIPLKESIIDAGKTRLEPVVLTSVCTVLGMVPLTISNPQWTSLGLSIIFGLSISTFFTLFVLPILYYIGFRGKIKNDQN